MTPSNSENKSVDEPVISLNGMKSIETDTTSNNNSDEPPINLDSMKPKLNEADNPKVTSLEGLVKEEKPVSPQHSSPLNSMNSLTSMGPLSTTDDEIRRVIIKCPIGMSEEKCIEDLVGPSSDHRVKVVHNLSGINSIAVAIKTSKIDQLGREGFVLRDDTIHKPLYIKE